MKHYDFLPDEQMDAVIGLLYSMVVYNYQRLRSLIDGLTQEEIDYQGADNELNSIAQLLRHLAVVDLHWVYADHSRHHYANIAHVKKILNI